MIASFSSAPASLGRGSFRRRTTGWSIPNPTLKADSLIWREPVRCPPYHSSPCPDSLHHLHHPDGEERAERTTNQAMINDCSIVDRNCRGEGGKEKRIAAISFSIAVLCARDPRCVGSPLSAINARTYTVQVAHNDTRAQRVPYVRLLHFRWKNVSSRNGA